jgi:hypothetical protein
VTATEENTGLTWVLSFGWKTISLLCIPCLLVMSCEFHPPLFLWWNEKGTDARFVIYTQHVTQSEIQSRNSLSLHLSNSTKIQLQDKTTIRRWKRRKWLKSRSETQRTRGEERIVFTKLLTTQEDEEPNQNQERTDETFLRRQSRICRRICISCESDSLGSESLFLSSMIVGWEERYLQNFDWISDEGSLFEGKENMTKQDDKERYGDESEKQP